MKLKTKSKDIQRMIDLLYGGIRWNKKDLKTLDKLVKDNSYFVKGK